MSVPVLKPRILHLISSFNQGGTERQAVSLVKALVADDQFEIFVATLNKEGVLLNEVENLGLPEIPEFKLTSFLNYNFFRQLSRCAKYIRDNRIDLVHTHDFYSNIFGMGAARLAGVRACIASKRETDGMRTTLQDMVERLAFQTANSIIANSAAVKNHLVERAISEKKIRVIYNGLDLSRFSVETGDVTKIGLPENARFVTLVANLRHPVKNIPMFLRASKYVAEVVPDAHFVIAGEGELEAELRLLASMLGLDDRVHFIGRCVDVPSLLSASYACVLTSVAEGFSNSILEYMAAGKPVVATNVGGAAEAIVDGESGYLVASDDDSAIAARLIELLDDAEMARRVGEKSREIVGAKFSTEANLISTTRIYKELIDEIVN